MPTPYTGDPDAVLIDPPTFSIVSDGDKRKAASVAPTLQQAADGIANYARYGAKLNATNTFEEPTNFDDQATFNRYARFNANTSRGTTPADLTDSATQTINPNTQNTNLYRGVTTAAMSRIVRLDTAGVFEGDWVRVFFNVVAGGGVWKFRRGADNTQEIATIDTTNFIAEVDVAVQLEFQVCGGVWRLVGTGQGVIPGAYA